jgi:glycosyltransferase involved in cell wall biosynthesis
VRGQPEFIVPPAPVPVEPLSQPSISVVIPCYQAAETVAAAVESALEQSLPPNELIVCDDGSTDQPERALAPYLDRIRLLRKENGGGASALNYCVSAATGELVAILDADDRYEPGRLQRLAELAAFRPDLDILVTDAWLEQDGERVGRYSEVNPFVVDDQRAGILDSCFPGGWPALRRQALLDAGGFDESYSVAYDWECWARMIHHGARAGMVNEPLLTYRIHGASLSANKVASLRERVRLFAEVGTWPLSGAERNVLRAATARDRRRLALEEVAAQVAAGASAAALLRLLASRHLGLSGRLTVLRLTVRRPSRRAQV